jgi:hypothetical protein
MDTLEILKKKWQENHSFTEKFDVNQLSKMILRKTTTISKNVFLVGLFDILFWLVLSLFLNFNKNEDFVYLKMKDDNVIFLLNLLYYSVIVFLIIQFYLSYQKSKLKDNNVKTTILNVLRIRKQIKLYLITNIFFILITGLITLYYYVCYDKNVSLLMLNNNFVNNKLLFYVIFSVIYFLFISFFSLIVYFFYKVLYGKLLKNLEENYKELIKKEF